jgi:hypothetical protein
MKKQPAQTGQKASVPAPHRKETFLRLGKSELQAVAGGGTLLPPIGYNPETTPDGPG